MNNFVCLGLILFTIPICMTQICEKRENRTAEYLSHNTNTAESKCWTIVLPQDSYIRLKVNLIPYLYGTESCSQINITVFVTETNDTYTYCSKDTFRTPIIALTDVTVTFSFQWKVPSNGYTRYSGITYSIESLICTKKDHFRCPGGICIHRHQVCNGINDCRDRSDEIGCAKSLTTNREMYASVKNAISWLKNQRSSSFSWGKNTPRAIIALYLADAVQFTGENLEEELMVKQLELQTPLALLGNCTDTISISELSTFVNALTVTCHNPRQFYGHDLLQTLEDRINAVSYSNPSAYLTLCNSNWKFTESDVQRVMNPLNEHFKYTFISDVRAVSIMALTCMKNKMEISSSDTLSKLYETTLEEFIAGQQPDGSFGNVYTTALVTQALISSGRNNTHWNITATAHYLMKQLNSPSVDFLSTYLALPVFNGKTLVDIAAVHCSNSRKLEADNEISVFTNKPGGKTNIQYSLFVGDQKDVVHTMFLRSPKVITAYEIMRMAQAADPKYKFLHRDVSGQMYIYAIGGIPNDPEAEKFWLLYTQNPKKNGTLTHYTESPDKYVMKDDEQLIMWYKTADI